MSAIEVLLISYARELNERLARSKAAMLQRVLCLLGGLFGMVATDVAALEIYFVRHAETLANVSGVHTTKTNTTFTQRGEEQIKALTSQLKGYQFDAILNSSLPPALNTIPLPEGEQPNLARAYRMLLAIPTEQPGQR